MKQRVKKFAEDVRAQIKDWIIQLRLIISDPEYRSVVLSPEYNLIRRSDVFDPDYYTNQKPHLRKLRERPLVEYMRRG
jgi:hypothetical protein